MISLVFAGTSAFAVPGLKALASDPRFAVTLVITQPDRPVGRKQVITPSPVKLLAQKLNLPLWQPENINKEWSTNPQLAAPARTIPFGSGGRNPQPDFLVVIAYGQILKQPVLDFPTVAAVNVHGSLLPRWRGASPVHHSLLNGDRTTGVTVQLMAAALDAGAILAQAETPIAERETFQSLHDRLAEMSAPLLLETLTKPLKPVEQDENEVTVCRKLSREDGVVNPHTHTAEEIDRKVRALNPWPGVTAEIDGTTLKLLETGLEDAKTSAPLPCRDGTMLHLVTVQTPGGKPMTGAEWTRGRKG